MHFSLGSDFRTPHRRVQVKAYDCLEALRIADGKLSEALDDYDPSAPYATCGSAREYLAPFDLAEMQAMIRLHTAALQECIGGVYPSVRESAFAAIRDFVNLDVRNAPHVEGVMLAMRLAYLSADDAVDLSQSLDPGESDEGYDILLATRAMAGHSVSVIESFAYCPYTKECLTIFLAGKLVPTWKELRREWTRETHPDGRYPNGQPTWDHVKDEPLYMTRDSELATA